LHLKPFLYIKGAVLTFEQGGLEGAVLESTTASLVLSCRWGHVLPEEGVVDVTTAVELEGGLEGNALLGGRCLGVRLLGSVQRVDVCL
jgi:hypothetical protein